MSCGAAFYFDAETDATIRGLWQLIEDAGLPSGMLKLDYAPHMTMLLCEDTDMDGAREVLPEFIAIHPPIPIAFHSLCVFNGETGIIYLAPVIDRPLLELHAALWDVLLPHTTNPSKLYRPDMWVPHVTLDLDVPPSQVGAVMDVLFRARRPAAGQLKELFIADFGADERHFEELFKAHLGANR